VAWVALAIAVIAIMTAFVWPGFLAITHCDPSRTPSEPVNGRVYCTVTIVIPPPATVAQRNASCRNATLPYSAVVYGAVAATSAWGFTFRASQYTFCISLAPGLNVTITEPNGEEYAIHTPAWEIGALLNSSCPLYPVCSYLLFTPDNESGVSYDASRAPPLVGLVEAGM
jgi:hypothetical protein